MIVGSFAKIESFSIHELIFSVIHNGFEFPNKNKFSERQFSVYIFCWAILRYRYLQIWCILARPSWFFIASI